MSEYNAKVYMKQGGDELVVDTGGKITAAGTQAAHIADASGTVSVEAFNAVLKALEDVGILKTS